MKVSFDMTVSNCIQIHGVTLTTRASVERLIENLRRQANEMWPKEPKK